MVCTAITVRKCRLTFSIGIAMGNPGIYGWRGTFPIVAGNVVRQITAAAGKPGGTAVGLLVTGEVTVLNNDVTEFRSGAGFNDSVLNRNDAPAVGGNAIGINIDPSTVCNIVCSHCFARY